MLEQELSADCESFLKSLGHDFNEWKKAEIAASDENQINRSLDGELKDILSSALRIHKVMIHGNVKNILEGFKNNVLNNINLDASVAVELANEIRKKRGSSRFGPRMFQIPFFEFKNIEDKVLEDQVLELMKKALNESDETEEEFVVDYINKASEMWKRDNYLQNYKIIEAMCLLYQQMFPDLSLISCFHDCYKYKEPWMFTAGLQITPTCEICCQKHESVNNSWLQRWIPSKLNPNQSEADRPQVEREKNPQPTESSVVPKVRLKRRTVKTFTPITSMREEFSSGDESEKTVLDDSFEDPDFILTDEFNISLNKCSGSELDTPIKHSLKTQKRKVSILHKTKVKRVPLSESPIKTENIKEDDLLRSNKSFTNITPPTSNEPDFVNPFSVEKTIEDPLKKTFVNPFSELFYNPFTGDGLNKTVGDGLNKTVKCDACEKTFRGKQSCWLLKRHKLMVHKDKTVFSKIYECGKQCCAIFPTQKELNNHKKTCRKNKKVTQSSVTYENPDRRVKTFVCDVCKKSYTRKYNLNTHLCKMKPL